MLNFRKGESFMIEQEKKYLDIIDAIVLILDNEGKINYVNKKALEILGYKEDELVGKNWFITCIPSRIREKIQGTFEAYRGIDGRISCTILV